MEHKKRGRPRLNRQPTPTADSAASRTQSSTPNQIGRGDGMAAIAVKSTRDLPAIRPAPPLPQPGPSSSAITHPTFDYSHGGSTSHGVNNYGGSTGHGVNNYSASSNHGVNNYGGSTGHGVNNYGANGYGNNGVNGYGNAAANGYGNVPGVGNGMGYGVNPYGAPNSAMHGPHGANNSAMHGSHSASSFTQGNFTGQYPVGGYPGGDIAGQFDGRPYIGPMMNGGQRGFTSQSSPRPASSQQQVNEQQAAFARQPQQQAPSPHANETTIVRQSGQQPTFGQQVQAANGCADVGPSQQNAQQSYSPAQNRYQPTRRGPLSAPQYAQGHAVSNTLAEETAAGGPIRNYNRQPNFPNRPLNYYGNGPPNGSANMQATMNNGSYTAEQDNRYQPQFPQQNVPGNMRNDDHQPAAFYPSTTPRPAAGRPEQQFTAASQKQGLAPYPSHSSGSHIGNYVSMNNRLDPQQHYPTPSLTNSSNTSSAVSKHFGQQARQEGGQVTVKSTDHSSTIQKNMAKVSTNAIDSSDIASTTAATIVDSGSAASTERAGTGTVAAQNNVSHDKSLVVADEQSRTTAAKADNIKEAQNSTVVSATAIPNSTTLPHTTDRARVTNESVRVAATSALLQEAMSTSMPNSAIPREHGSYSAGHQPLLLPRYQPSAIASCDLEVGVQDLDLKRASTDFCHFFGPIPFIQYGMKTTLYHLAHEQDREKLYAAHCALAKAVSTFIQRPLEDHDYRDQFRPLATEVLHLRVIAGSYEPFTMEFFESPNQLFSPHLKFQPPQLIIVRCKLIRTPTLSNMRDMSFQHVGDYYGNEKQHNAPWPEPSRRRVTSAEQQQFALDQYPQDVERNQFGSFAGPFDQYRQDAPRSQVGSFADAFNRPYDSYNAGSIPAASQNETQRTEKEGLSIDAVMDKRGTVAGACQRSGANSGNMTNATLDANIALPVEGVYEAARRLSSDKGSQEFESRSVGQKPK
jgi:hypothetical protein